MISTVMASRRATLPAFATDHVPTRSSRLSTVVSTVTLAVPTTSAPATYPPAAANRCPLDARTAPEAPVLRTRMSARRWNTSLVAGSRAVIVVMVVDSPYSDEIMRTIAHIELGWIQQRLRRQTIDEEINNESYNRAVREMSILIPEKQRTIRDALPPKVRAEWETVDYLSQTQPKPSGSTLPTGKQ